MTSEARHRAGATSAVALASFLTAISIQAVAVIAVHQGRMTGPFLVSERVAPHLVLPVEPREGSVGYDGQFFLALALSPRLGDPRLVDTFDEPAYRARRILWPFLAHVSGFGRPEAVVPALYLWLAISVAGGSWAIAWWTARLGRSPWWGLLYAANLGVVACLWRMLGDVVMSSLLLIALVALRHGAPARAMLPLGGAILAKETALLGALALFSVAAWNRKWILALWAVVSTVPALLWWSYVSWKFGDIGDSLVRENFVFVPAAGLVASAVLWLGSNRAWWAVGKDLILATIHLMPLAALAASILHGKKTSERAANGWSYSVLALLAWAFCLLPLLLGIAVWEELWAFSRALLPISPLAFLWALEQRRPISSTLAAAPFVLLAVAGVAFVVRLALGQTP